MSTVAIVASPVERLTQALGWRIRNARLAARYAPARLSAWWLFKRRVGRYRLLTEQQLLGTRRSDTVFIFGSGYSLNEMTREQWDVIEQHDTLGFNWFVREPYVRCDYHLVREIAPDDLDDNAWRPALREYFAALRDNPRYRSTILLVQTGFRAINGNRAIGLGLVPENNRVFLWRTRDAAMPTASFAEGLSHSRGTLHECINFAALGGWRRIVLVGVDLYDRRYFWLRHDERRPDDPETDATVHRTAREGVIDSVGEWRNELERRGITLYVHNPRSLLNQVLPVWNVNTR